MSRSDAYTEALTRTPQSSRVPGRADQVENRAGGYVFELDDWGVLDRFLILGTESPTYYADSKELTVDALDRVLRCVASDPDRVVSRAVEVSESGRAPSNSAAIFTVALVAARADDETSKAFAYSTLNRVCRTGTHLFEFMNVVKGLRGTFSGSGLRRALRRWYFGKPPGDLAYQLLKYRQREGWTHADVLRLAKPRQEKDGHHRDYDTLFRVAHEGGVGLSTSNEDTSLKDEKASRIVTGFAAAQEAGDDHRLVAKLVAEYSLTREMIPPQSLAHVEVWDALLERMPATATLRNLGKMTQIGLLKPLGKAVRVVVDRLTDAETLKRARLHPAVILNAYKTYAQGRGLRGSLTWEPVQEVLEALDRAFSLAFSSVESTGKRFYLGVDVSGSMSMWNCAGLSAITPAEGAAAMAMAVARVEPRHVVLGFSSGDDSVPIGTKMRDLGVTARDTLVDVLRKTRRQNFGRTDCALPMIDAKERDIEVDCFVVLTDNETWHGRVHPFQALQEYRRASGIDAKLVVVGMTATQFSIADPTDAGMLDVVGFDAAAPRIITEFAAGRV